MSVVSGIATASGVSSLLNAPGGNQADAAKRGRGVSETAATSALRIDHTITRIVERLTGADSQAAGSRAKGQQTNVAPGNGGYSLFVDAVQALRLDKATAEELTPERVAQLKAAAAEVFNMRSDIPRDQRPVEAFEEQRQADLQREAIAQAERDQAVQRAKDAERVREAARIPQDGTMPEQTGTTEDVAIGGSVPEVAKPKVAAKPAPQVPDTPKPEIRVPGSEPSGDTPAPSGAEAAVPDSRSTTPAPASEPA